MRCLLPVILTIGIVAIPTRVSAQAADTSFRAYFTALPTRPEEELKAEIEGEDKLQAGFASLEMHRRTKNQAHASRAARLFGDIIRKNEKQTWARFGLANALIRMPRTINIVRAMGVTREHEARHAAETQLEKALALDPNFAEAAALRATIRKPEEAVSTPPTYTNGNLYF